MVVDLPQPFDPRKPKNLPAWNAEIDVINGNEGTKTHGQIARFDGNLCIFRLIRWDHYRLMRGVALAVTDL